jgi:hypothetical protein
MAPQNDPAPLPPLPDAVEAEALRELDDSELDAVLEAISASERATRSAMAPYERQLAELRARAGEVATEQRRRERASHVASRAAVREGAKAGALPSVADVLTSATAALDDDRPLASVRAYLRTGGEVGFGFPTRPGIISFTDGRRTVPANTVGEARRLYAQGLEPGIPGVSGVRVHLAGTRVERLLSADEVVVAVDSATNASAPD